MKATRPKLIIDTNVFIDAAKGTIPRSVWRRATERIRHEFRCCISFITVKELLAGLVSCPDSHFEGNKEELRLLYGLGKRRFLAYPSVFILRTVLGLATVSRSGQPDGLSDEEWAERVLNAVLAARSKEELKKGITLHRGIRPQAVSFDLDDFAYQENIPQIEHVSLLEGMRERLIDKPKAITMAAWILHQHGLPRINSDCERLAPALDAAFRFSLVLTKNTINDKGYSFFDHQSNWGDAAQLLYLCDPEMRFLTREEKCCAYTVGSPQSHQILRWSDFVSMA